MHCAVTRAAIGSGSAPRGGLARVRAGAAVDWDQAERRIHDRTAVEHRPPGRGPVHTASTPPTSTAWSTAGNPPPTGAVASHHSAVPSAGTTRCASALSQFWFVTCSRVTRPRRTLSRMDSAVAVQTNGFGSSLCACRYSSIAALSSGTLRNTPRRIALSVSSRNHRSTRFNHDEEVGVKCRWKRGRLASHALTLSWLWVP